jgi:hypothetical protein
MAAAPSGDSARDRRPVPPTDGSPAGTPRSRAAIGAVLGLRRGAAKLELRSGGAEAAQGRPRCRVCEGPLVAAWVDGAWCPPPCKQGTYCGTCWPSRAPVEEREAVASIVAAERAAAAQQREERRQAQARAAG